MTFNIHILEFFYRCLYFQVPTVKLKKEHWYWSDMQEYDCRGDFILFCIATRRWGEKVATKCGCSSL